MSVYEFGSNLKFLSELLNPKKDDEESEDEKDELITSDNNYLTPADLHKNKESEEKEESSKIPEKQPEDEYLEKGDELSDPNDWKKTPLWEVSYKQNVSASDVFLQMGPKNPSTASCECMVLKISLPGESRQNVDLKVLKFSLELSTPKFYLKIPLPHPVNPQLGDAKFDSDTEKLIVTLIMDREFDYMNL